MKQIIAILNDLQLIAERESWHTDKGIELSQKIKNRMHNGVYGSIEGCFVQTQKAINDIQKHCIDRELLKEKFIKFIEKECMGCEGLDNQGEILWKEFEEELLNV